MTSSIRSPISPGINSDVGTIPITLSSPPLSSPPPAAPITGLPHIATLQERHPQGRFREEGVDGRDGRPPLPPMPFSPEPPSPSAVKWSHVRKLRTSLKHSKRLPQPLPSPSVCDGFSEGDAPPPEESRSAKRKTLLQRAIEGWWDLPGLLGRSDTVRGKTKPFPSTAKEPAGFV